MSNPLSSTSTPRGASQTEIGKRNEASILRNAHALAARNLEGAVAGFSPDIIWRSSLFPQPIVGPAEAKKAIQQVLKMFPGISFDRQLLITSGNYVVALWKTTGSEINDFMGISHFKGREYEILDMVINEFNEAGERIAIWDCFDWGTLLRQIGLLSPISPDREETGDRGETSASDLPSDLHLPTTFPPGVDPELYKIETVNRLLDEVASFPMGMGKMSGHSMAPVRRKKEVVGLDVSGPVFHFIPSLTITHRDRPAAGSARPAVARLSTRLLFMPDNFVARPKETPPPTPMNPARSQRFLLTDVRLDFGQPAATVLAGFGTGRTFPVITSDRRELRFGGVLDFPGGDGQLAGRDGIAVMNGQLRPQSTAALDVVLRVKGEVDGSQQPMSSTQESQYVVVTPRRARKVEPAEIVLVFLGTMDAKRPVEFKITAAGRFLGANGHEVLRLVKIRYSIGKEISHHQLLGQPVVQGSFEIVFDPFAAGSPLPFQTTNGEWIFLDRNEKEIGRLHANIVEGRAFPTHLAGAPMKVYRVGGLAPILRGSGIFSKVTGLITINVWLSIFPRALNNVMMIRLNDPERHLLRALERAWA